MLAQIERQRWTRDRFGELVPSLLTKDGLLPSSEIVRQDDRTLRLRADPRVEVHPHWRAGNVADELSSNDALWKGAAIRVQPSRPMVNRAPVYGVPFGRAVEIVLREGSHKSRFHLERDENGGLYSELLLLFHRQKPSNGGGLVLEAFEWIGDGVEIDYAHMILSPDGRTAIHLDGALVTFDAEAAAAAIFDSGAKRKGVQYEKYFRVDQPMSIRVAVQLIRSFFPIEELAGEAFQLESDGRII